MCLLAVLAVIGIESLEALMLAFGYVSPAYREVAEVQPKLVLVDAPGDNVDIADIQVYTATRGLATRVQFLVIQGLAAFSR